MSERMPAQDFVRVGTITRPHGLRGEVSVALCTAAPENMLAYRRVFLSAAGDRGSAEKREFQVLQARLADKGALLLLSGCNSRNEAELLRGCPLWVRRRDLPQLQAGEWYLHDLMGKEARDCEGLPLGRITAVMDNGVQTLLVLRHGGGESLIPAVAAFIARVEADAVIFSLPEGLVARDSGHDAH